MPHYLPCSILSGNRTNSQALYADSFNLSRSVRLICLDTVTLQGTIRSTTPIRTKTRFPVDVDTWCLNVLNVA